MMTGVRVARTLCMGAQEDDTMTLDEGLTSFMTYLKAERGLSKNTQVSYFHDIALFIAYLMQNG